MKHNKLTKDVLTTMLSYGMVFKYINSYNTIISKCYNIYMCSYFCSHGFIVNNVFHPLYWSCFNRNRMEVLYVWYNQNPTNAVHQTGVDRPSWLGKISTNLILWLFCIYIHTCYGNCERLKMIIGYHVLNNVKIKL